MAPRGQRHFSLAFLICLLALPPAGVAQSSPTTTSSQEAAVRTKLSEGIVAKINAASISSLADAEAVAEAFNAYLRERTGHGLSEATVLRLAQAEWLARIQGEGTIPVSQLASLATRVFVEKLGGPGATPPTGSVGTPYYVLTSEKINGARAFYRRYATSVTGSNLPEDAADLSASSSLPSVQKAFPIEALFAVYVCVSEDLGFAISAVEESWRQRKGNPTASPKGKPYGNQGYLLGRPISKLLTDEIVNRILDLAS